MEKDMKLEKLLEIGLEAEMTIRSLTTKLQRLNETVDLIREYRQRYLDYKLDIFVNKDSLSETEVNDKQERADRLKNIVDAHEHMLCERMDEYQERINDEILNIKQTVDRLPSKVSKTSLGLFNDR